MLEAIKLKLGGLSRKQIIGLISIVVLFPFLVYGATVGYRLYKVYNTVYQPIDAAYEPIEPITPMDLIEEGEEPEEEDIPEDQAELYRYTDDPLYAKRRPKDPNKLNILLIGTDSQGGAGGYRSDTIMVVQFDKSTKESAILSIPRDTYIKIPGRGYDKAGHAYAYGGVRLLKETVEDYLDIHIDHYAQVGMDGFEAIVNTLGGIPVYVSHDMINSRNGRTLFTQGHHHMNGEDVLTYVRARHLTVGGSDFGRIKRQQQVMVIIFEQVTQNFSLNKTLELLESISPFLRTDVTPMVVMNNWSNFTSVHPNDIKLVTLEGYGFTYNRVYYYRVPIEDARKTMNQLTR